MFSKKHRFLVARPVGREVSRSLLCIPWKGNEENCANFSQLIAKHLCSLRTISDVRWAGDIFTDVSAVSRVYLCCDTLNPKACKSQKRPCQQHGYCMVDRSVKEKQNCRFFFFLMSDNRRNARRTVRRYGFSRRREDPPRLYYYLLLPYSP